jgi:methylenetetrahydrofolate reductase (NADPH)
MWLRITIKKWMQAMTAKSKFGQALASNRLVLTAECLPPRTGGANAITELAAVLPAALDAVVVADNPDEVYGSALACAALLAREGREAVLTMTTRDRNRIALASDARGASALGINAILCLSGNHQSLGTSPQAAGANDIDSVQLTQAVKALDLPDMLVGEVAHPYQKPLELNLIRLKKKIAAGADFIVTEPVFDVAAFVQWMDAVREAGLHEQAAIIAGVLPLTSVEQVEFLKQRKTYGPLDQDMLDRVVLASDPAKEGLAWATEIVGQIRSIQGVRGIHILSGGVEAVAGELIAAAKIA